MGILTVLFYVGGLFVLGVFPVIGRVLAERRPSPYGQSWAHVESAQNQLTMVPAQFQQNTSEKTMQPFGFEIPVFSADESESTLKEIKPFKDEELSYTDEVVAFTDEEVPFPDEEVSFEPEVIHSIPDLEMMDNIDTLVASFQEEFADRESISPLSPNEYGAISKKYGEKVAAMITATPTSSITSKAQQVMMGRICVEENEAFLKYQDDKVLLRGKVPLYDGEVILVNGHFIKEGIFHVLNYEDAETAVHYDIESAVM